MMKATYLAFSSRDGDTYVLVYEGLPGASLEVSRKIAILRIGLFAFPADEMATLKRNLLLVTKATANTIPPLRKARQTLLQGPYRPDVVEYLTPKMGTDVPL